MRKLINTSNHLNSTIAVQLDFAVWHFRFFCDDLAWARILIITLLVCPKFQITQGSSTFCYTPMLPRKVSSGVRRQGWMGRIEVWIGELGALYWQLVRDKLLAAMHGLSHASAFSTPCLRFESHSSLWGLFFGPISWLRRLWDPAEAEADHITCALWRLCSARPVMRVPLHCFQITKYG